MSDIYKPNYWQILRITSPEGKVFHKVFATWTGGYTYGDSWKMNSGIVEVTYEDNIVTFKGYSGSLYQCIDEEHLYRTTAYTQGVLSNITLQADKVGAIIEVLPFETNWKKLI